MMRLLVTGFGPFPRVPRNPSAALALAVVAAPRWRLVGVQPRGRVLTTAYAALGTELAPELAGNPDAVLLIGVAGRSRSVRVEGRATSRRSTLFADEAGRTGTAVRRDTAARQDLATHRGPAARRSALPPAKALLALRARAVPSRISRDAGRYLCNAAYFQALAERKPVLFIHIPMPPRTDRARAPGSRPKREGDKARLRDALVEVGMLLARQARVEGWASRMASSSAASRSQPA